MDEQEKPWVLPKDVDCKVRLLYSDGQGEHLKSKTPRSHNDCSYAH